MKASQGMRFTDFTSRGIGSRVRSRNAYSSKQHPKTRPIQTYLLVFFRRTRLTMNSLFASFLCKIGPRAITKVSCVTARTLTRTRYHQPSKSSYNPEIFFEQAKVSPNSRAASELWERLYGNCAEDEVTEEQLKVFMEAVAAQEQEEASPETASVASSAPVASPGARQQLQDFMRQMNMRNRTTGSSTSGGFSPENRPFTQQPSTTSSSLRSAQPPPPAVADPPIEDLRVPVRWGDPNMVHVAQ